MQAVILCAGRGYRMGELTQDTPKPLLKIKEKTLIEHKLDLLPDNIQEIVLTLGYKGDRIVEHFGYSYKGRPIKYFVNKTISGTAHSLWSAKDGLKDRFLVIMGDDIYDKKTIEECSKHDFSIACKRGKVDEKGSRIITDESGNLIDFVTHKMYQRHHDDGGLIFTGLYSLTTDIFNYNPVKLETRDEWGLPQTLLKAAKDHHVEIIETDFWIQITDEDDLKKAEIIL